MIDIVKAKHVMMHPLAIVGMAWNIGPYFLGFHIYAWGIRLMLITIHICIRWDYWD